MKRILKFTLTGIAGVVMLSALAACSNSAKSGSSHSSSSSKTNQSSSSASKSSSSAKPSSSSAAASSSSAAPAVVSMNPQQIASGNLSSILGTWKNANGDNIVVASNSITINYDHTADAAMSLGTYVIYSNYITGPGFMAAQGNTFPYSGYISTSSDQQQGGMYSIPLDGNVSAADLIMIPKGISFATLQPTGNSYSQSSGNTVAVTSKGDASNINQDRMFITNLQAMGLGPHATEITGDETSAVFYKVN